MKKNGVFNLFSKGTGNNNNLSPLLNMFMNSNKNNNQQNTDNNIKNTNTCSPNNNNNNNQSSNENGFKKADIFPTAPLCYNRYSKLIEKHDAISKKIDRANKNEWNNI